jgi:hypothetical protein
MKLIEIIAISIGIVSGVISFIGPFFSVVQQKFLFPALGVLSITTAVLVYFIVIGQNEISFVNLKNGAIISTYDHVDPKTNQVHIPPVQFHYTGRLGKDEIVALFMKVSGGELWWVSGTPVTSPEMNGNFGSIGAVTIGEVDDGNRQYDLLLAVIDKARLKAGTKSDQLPNSTLLP